MQNIYETEIYAENNPSWHEEDAAWKAKQIANIINKNKVQFETVSEVGCGTGDILLNLENTFSYTKAYGYEVSPFAYKRAKLKETHRTKFYLKNVLDAEIPSVDLLLLIDVMEHVEDYLGFLRKLKPLSKLKVFHIPLDLSIQSLIREKPILNLRKNVGHLHYFFKNSAITSLVDCGYNIIDCTYTPSRLELPNQAFSSRLMKIPRQFMFSLNPDLTVKFLGGYSLLVLAE